MRVSTEEMKRVRGGAVFKTISLGFIAGEDGESQDGEHGKWIDIIADSD